VTRLHLDLEHEPQSASAARAAVAAHVRSAWPLLDGLEDLLDDLQLVTGELVANAVLHGEPPLSVDVDATRTEGRHLVTLICQDGGPWDGTPSEPESGRGFVIVRALTRELRIDADATGTSIRVTLER
jgi:anti-sigma regulatory factor (Ser/Thr protein kinase)